MCLHEQWHYTILIASSKKTSTLRTWEKNIIHTCIYSGGQMGKLARVTYILYMQYIWYICNICYSKHNFCCISTRFRLFWTHFAISPCCRRIRTWCESHRKIISWLHWIDSRPVLTWQTSLALQQLALAIMSNGALWITNRPQCWCLS